MYRIRNFCYGAEECAALRTAGVLAVAKCGTTGIPLNMLAKALKSQRMWSNATGSRTYWISVQRKESGKKTLLMIREDGENLGTVVFGTGNNFAGMKVRGIAKSCADTAAKSFNPEQERDEDGRWTSGGGQATQDGGKTEEIPAPAIQYKTGTHTDYIRLKNEAQKQTHITAEQRNSVYTHNWNTVSETWTMADIGKESPGSCAGKKTDKYFNSGVGSQKINEALRTNSVANLTKQQQQTVKVLKKLIEKFPLAEARQVTRYVDDDWLNAMLPQAAKKDYTSEVGKTVTDNQFVSVSVSDKNVLHQRDVKLLINVPAGTKMYVSENLMESEAVLYKPVYLVKNIRAEAQDKTIIELEVKK